MSISKRKRGEMRKHIVECYSILHVWDKRMPMKRENCRLCIVRLALKVGRFNPPPGLNPGLTRVGLNPLFGLNPG